jgi:hypothetical protein
MIASISKNAFSPNIVVIPYLIIFQRRHIVIDAHNGMFQYKDISENLCTKQKFICPVSRCFSFKYTSINIPYFMAFPFPWCILYRPFVFIYILTLANYRHCRNTTRRPTQGICQKPVGTGLHGRPRRKREDNIKIDRKEAVCGLDSCNSAYGLVSGCNEHSN